MRKQDNSSCLYVLFPLTLVSNRKDILYWVFIPLERFASFFSVWMFLIARTNAITHEQWELFFSDKTNIVTN